MQTVQIGDWFIKASSLDDQIFVCGYKKNSIDTFAMMFYNEETAFSFMEKIYDKDYKTHHG